MSVSTVLVTGGAGMIGSNLVKRLVRDGHRVRVIDNLWRGKIEHLLDQNGAPVIDLDTDFIKADLSVFGPWEQAFRGVDAVFHLADVVAGIDYVFRNQGMVFRQNLLINSNAVEAARRHRPGAFVYVDTACSFPAEKQTGVDAPPLREEDLFPAHPESAYGWSKLLGQYEALLAEKESGVPTSVLVLHNVYGTPTDFEGSRAQVVPALVAKAIRFPEEPFVVWGTGSQGRAFVHVDDVVDALVASLSHGLGAGPIQIGPDSCTSIRTLAETVVAVSGKDMRIEFDTSKPEGDRGRCADYSKARRLLGWAPRVGLEEGLRGVYGWVEDQMRIAPAAR